MPVHIFCSVGKVLKYAVEVSAYNLENQCKFTAGTLKHMEVPVMHHIYDYMYIHYVYV